ncbi:MAG: hypothetical protein IJ643_02150, partial [Eubacterium sp.]|nr:hypothetical protein [Eubacterium sp.]
LKCPLGRQPKRTFVLCSDKKSADFRMQSSFDKVILVHKCITKFPAYSRMQGIFNAFRDKRSKSKPILRYRTSPKLSLVNLYKKGGTILFNTLGCIEVTNSVKLM